MGQTQSSDVAIFYCSVPLNSDASTCVANWLPDSLVNAAQGRKNEYLAGRYCALKACEEIEVDLNSLPSGPNRQPLWPNEIVGSISHTKEYAVCAVSLKSNFQGIGIDVEKIIDVARFHTIEKMILVDEELNEYSSLADEKKKLIFTLIFSAKESLFKCLYPLCEEYFDFKEARMTGISLEDGKFSLELISDNSRLSHLLGTYSGTFTVFDGKVQTLIKYPV